MAGFPVRDWAEPDVRAAQLAHDLMVTTWCASALLGAARSSWLTRARCQVEYVSFADERAERAERFDALWVLPFALGRQRRDRHAWDLPWAEGWEHEDSDERTIRIAVEADRGTEKLAILLKAKTGEPFEVDGRRIHVTPSPLTPGGPMVAWGGGSIAAAERAGRNGLGFFAQKGDPALGVAYEHAARDAGHTPGMCILPPLDSPSTVFVADDLDRAWEELGPYLMHDVVSYAAWNEGNSDTTSLSFASTADELRAENRSHRIMTVEEAIDHVRSGSPLALHPLVGGLPPDIAWRYLTTVVDEVMPAVTG